MFRSIIIALLYEVIYVQAQTTSCNYSNQNITNNISQEISVRKCVNVHFHNTTVTFSTQISINIPGNMVLINTTLNSPIVIITP
jgi:hypothetical protein